MFKMLVSLDFHRKSKEVRAALRAATKCAYFELLSLLTWLQLVSQCGSIRGVTAPEHCGRGPMPASR